jgi:hypothetical protein
MAFSALNCTFNNLHVFFFAKHQVRLLKPDFLSGKKKKQNFEIGHENEELFTPPVQQTVFLRKPNFF